MNHQRPQLKNGVDLQLQSAFSDGNWPVVVRLAEKRARSLNDQYYEIVKICAESQLDDPGAKFAALAALDKFVKEGSVIKDVDAIDLLEWATGSLTPEEDFAETLGPLRVRLAKASPKDGASVSRCLESCLLHWDLVSAQQIAAILDRSFPGKAHFMFWNIVITHLLATSAQLPPDKSKLYGTLALKQIQRAAQASEQDGTKDAKPPRSVQSEEEILLLYDIVEKHGNGADFDKLIASPVFCPLAQFRAGRKEILLRVVAKYQRGNDWEAIYRLCKDCLSLENEDGTPSLLALDWAIWRLFILSAAQMKRIDAGTEKTVQALLKRFIKLSNLRPIHRRNILLARLSASFNLAPNDGDDVVDGQPSTLRLRELISYLQDQATSSACFDDIRGFVEQLSPAAMKYLAFERVPRLADETEGQVNSARVRMLGLKLQYLVSTCPYMYINIPGEARLRKCTVTGQEFEGVCGPSFATISRSAVELHQSLSDIVADHPAVDSEIRPDLALLIALCNIQQALPISSQASKPLIRALLVLESQLALSPKHGAISLLLVQLHLRLGAAPRASEIWDGLGVKRTIMDSLGPVFYDRLSILAPALISPSDNAGWQLMDLMSSHYSVSLKLRMPRRLIDAFETNSYSSVLSIPEYMENLRWSCTRAMSLVEEARTERALGERFTDVLQDPRFTEVTDDTQLKAVIDYGSFPSWGCSSLAPIYAHLRVGPAPTNRRAHLSLLSEAFHEILSYKPPAGYKASPGAAAPEQVFVLEMLTQLSNSLSRFLHGSPEDLTPAEAVYFELVSLLSTLIPAATTISRSAPVPEILAQIIAAVKAGLETLQEMVVLERSPEELLSSLHTVGIFRDAAAATKHASQWIQVLNEREKERDRSGKSNLPKELMTQVKALQAAADASLTQGRQWIATLRKQVSGRDFQPRWILDDDELRHVVGEEAVAKLVNGWEANLKGWTQVKWT